MSIPTAPVGFIQTVLPVPAYVDNIVLVGVAKTVTVPAGATYCFISVTDETWMRTGGTAAAPAGDVVDGTGSALILPRDEDEARFFRLSSATPTFSLFGAASSVSIAWYREHGSGVLA